MCGIAGIWNFDEGAVEPAQLALITNLQHHRGPDDLGYVWFDKQGQVIGWGRDLQALNTKGPLAFGHRRLSIIDLDETGRQPMSYANGRYWICYNGEIYNYLELREQLKSLGYRFVSTSDTEVILAAYRHWGVDCVKRFNGMWAFALWDTTERILFCSRDRVGIKPFYYYLDAQRFVFASEIKSVLAALPADKFALNEPYLGRFIIGGLLDDADDTLFAHVKQLPPAHCLLLKPGQAKFWRYWDIPDECIERADRLDIDENQAIEQFRELLTDAIRLRFRADVPVGTCLSGGLDSSTVVALATTFLSAQLSTFTTEYDEAEFSEGRYARAAAAHHQTDAHYITPQPHQYIDFIDRFSFYHDEPCPGPGPFSQWHVMQLASKHVKVVLDGQGADELLAGYTHYFNYYLTTVLSRAIQRNGSSCQPTIKQYFTDTCAIGRHLNIPLRQSCFTALNHIANRTLPASVRNFTRPFRRLTHRAAGAGAMFNVANPDLLRHALPAYRPRPRRYRDDLNEIMYWELTRDNIPMLMQYGDRTSMAFSIESRVPFLDYRLMEFVGSLPYHLKIRTSTTKYLMRRALRGLLPDDVVDRPDKKGYPTPFALWLKGPLKDYVLDMIRSGPFRSRGLFHPDKVETLMNQHLAERTDHAWLLWRIVNIERWLGVFHDDFAHTCRQHLNHKF